MKLKNLIAVGLVAAPVAALAGTTLNGAGATFPAPLYQRWFQDYAAATGNRVNYQSVGSGAGVRQYVAGTVDFAASDEPISSKEASKVKRGVVQIPMVGGTIAIAYNKPGCSLKLTQKQTVDVFSGRIKDWKALGCAAGPIKVVHRSDGSGTTFAFTNSLQTSGAIGYVNTGFVRANKLQAAAVQNKAGQFVLPTAKSGAIALNSITLDSNLAGENPNPSAAGAYPISTLTWILAYKSGNGARKAGDIQQALNYALSAKAQMIADDLGYVPLAGSILNKSRIAVKRIGN